MRTGEAGDPLPCSAAMTARAPSITTPTFDVVMTGGLSLVVMSAILAWSFASGQEAGFVNGEWLVPMILVNATHFMASYRLLYVSKAEILDNRWSAIYVPIALLSVLGLAALAKFSAILLTIRRALSQSSRRSPRKP